MRACPPKSYEGGAMRVRSKFDLLKQTNLFHRPYSGRPRRNIQNVLAIITFSKLRGTAFHLQHANTGPELIFGLAMGLSACPSEGFRRRG
jgi:hypothetical protein